MPRQSVIAYKFTVKATRTGVVAFDPNIVDSYARAQAEVELIRAELDKLGEVKGGAKITTRNFAAPAGERAEAPDPLADLERAGLKRAP
jgi:hypothetical protein